MCLTGEVRGRLMDLQCSNRNVLVQAGGAHSTMQRGFWQLHATRSGQERFASGCRHQHQHRTLLLRDSSAAVIVPSSSGKCTIQGRRASEPSSDLAGRPYAVRYSYGTACGYSTHNYPSSCCLRTPSPPAYRPAPWPRCAPPAASSYASLNLWRCSHTSAVRQYLRCCAARDSSPVAAARRPLCKLHHHHPSGPPSHARLAGAAGERAPKTARAQLSLCPNVAGADWPTQPRLRPSQPSAGCPRAAECRGNGTRETGQGPHPRPSPLIVLLAPRRSRSHGAETGKHRRPHSHPWNLRGASHHGGRLAALLRDRLRDPADGAVCRIACAAISTPN
jgi:hypothetical protein